MKEMAIRKDRLFKLILFYLITWGIWAMSMLNHDMWSWIGFLGWFVFYNYSLIRGRIDIQYIICGVHPSNYLRAMRMIYKKRYKEILIVSVISAFMMISFLLHSTYIKIITIFYHK